jgi:hypothetical protein
MILLILIKLILYFNRSLTHILDPNKSFNLEVEVSRTKCDTKIWMLNWISKKMLYEKFRYLVESADK